MNIICAILFFLILSFAVCYAYLELKSLLETNTSKVGIILFILHIIILLCWLLYNLTATNPFSEWRLRNLDGSDIGLVSLIGYIFIWWIFSLGLSAPLVTVEFLLLNFKPKEKNSSANRYKEHPGFDLSVESAFISISACVAINLTLYAFGISDILIFETLLR